MRPALRSEAESEKKAELFSKTRMCRFFAFGKCAKGIDCMFAHDREELQPIPDLYRTKICRMLINVGECADPECSYAHNKQELRTGMRPSQAYNTTRALTRATKPGAQPPEAVQLFDAVPVQYQEAPAICKHLINVGECTDPECHYAHNKQELHMGMRPSNVCNSTRAFGRATTPGAQPPDSVQLFDTVQVQYQEAPMAAGRVATCGVLGAMFAGRPAGYVIEPANVCLVGTQIAGAEEEAASPAGHKACTTAAGTSAFMQQYPSLSAVLAKTPSSAADAAMQHSGAQFHQPPAERPERKNGQRAPELWPGQKPAAATRQQDPDGHGNLLQQLLGSYPLQPQQLHKLHQPKQPKRRQRHLVNRQLANNEQPHPAGQLPQMMSGPPCNPQSPPTTMEEAKAQGWSMPSMSSDECEMSPRLISWSTQTSSEDPLVTTTPPMVLEGTPSQVPELADLVSIGSLTVKNTFLDFGPKAPVLRTVRSASARFCFSGSSDEN